jgi:membrane-associated phospholipid phosphatase
VHQNATPQQTPAPGPTTLLLAAMAAAACAVLARQTGVRLAFGDGSLQALSLLVGLRAYVGWRMPHLERVMLILSVLPVFVVAAATVGFLSYFAPLAGFPLRDAELRALDLALGFDWLAVARAADAFPWLVRVLGLSYITLPVQALAVVLLLGAARQREDLERFAIAFILSTLVVVAVSAACPAYGPAPTLARPDQFATLTLSGTWGPAAIARDIRQSGLSEIDLGKLAGIITFPSFHTVVTLLVPWALRRTPAFWPALALNALMLASTITEGGHYLVDLIAGAVVTVFAVACASAATRWLDPWLRGVAAQLGRKALAHRPATPAVAEARVQP